MEYKASARYIRISPRKVRLVVEAVKAQLPDRAVETLEHMPKRAAEPVRTLLLSAIANARNKQAKSGDLRIKTLEVTEGPVMKRWRAVSRGTAHGYKKRMSHIRLVLTDEGIKE